LEANLSVPVTIDEDRRGRTSFPLEETRLHRLVLSSARILAGAFINLEVSGADNLPRDGAVIVVANHLSDLDLLPLQLALPRPLFSMDRSDRFRGLFPNAILRSLGVFPSSPGSRDEWAFSHARDLLHFGQVVCIFPEGTRSRGMGLKVARSEAARLALTLKCPIVPAALEGSVSLFRTFHPRGRVRVTICEPVLPHPNELALALTDRLMFCLARSLPPDLRGVYAEAPAGF
jgi:1-acyl-sn-glycerol-3-phosphate acyltransferase